MLSLLSTPGLSLKLVRPKALLDNCFRVMELLYCSCCKETPWVGWATVSQGDLGPGLWAECTLSWECSLFLIDGPRVWRTCGLAVLSHSAFCFLSYR